MSRPVGIDLGTTHSVVAQVQANRAVVLPNREGQLLTPSVVAYPPEGPVLVGEPAVERARIRPQEAVFSAKRWMGSDHTFGVPRGQVTPVEVSAEILGKLARDASLHLGYPVREAVVTVPAYFNARQREDTLRAAERAGLGVIRILNEPTAAALAWERGNADPGLVMVWDLGGGTFDVSILRTGYGLYEVLSVGGDNFLGGDDWDTVLAEHLAEHLGELLGPRPGERPLRTLARQARERLSQVESVDVELPGASFRLTRSQLETLTRDLARRLEKLTLAALDRVDLGWSEIDRMILAGGATRMPAVRALASGLLGKDPATEGNPDLVVALGAAYQAALLEGRYPQAGDLPGRGPRFTLVDVLPLSVGIEVESGGFVPLIPGNSPIPARASRLFTTAQDDQESILVQVLQGEHPRAMDNVSLGIFELPGLAAMPRGKPLIEVSFEVDSSGILRVTAEDLHGGTCRGVEIVPTGGLAPALCPGGPPERRRPAPVLARRGEP